jgi:D-threonate/D-erythronate kinase
VVNGVIVADDLTGAADACATFVTCGWSGTVVFGVDADADADVVAVSTNTRGLPATLAIDRVRATVRELTTAHPSALLFKKIDSTLRGHVGREITAAMDVSRASLAIVAPAFPAMGRTVRDGVLQVAGASTFKPRHVTALLEGQGVRACQPIACPGAVADATCGWRDSMMSAVRAGARVLVCDSATDDDLDAIVRAVPLTPGRVLWVGSAGLAGALARHLSQGGDSVDAPVEASSGRFAGPVVFWIGSHHPVTVEQRRRLLARPGVAAAGGSVNSIERVSQLLDRRVHVVLDVGPAVSDEMVGKLVERVVDRPVGGFVMSGGETAARVCRALDASAIQLAGEVTRGIPHGVLRTRSNRRWPIVLKSGGFGTPRAFADVLAFLCRIPTPN